jgi:transposase InsO family protein
LKGEFARSLTITDVFTGWTEDVAIRNNAHANIIEGLEILEQRVPFRLTGFDSDNGSEFINHEVMKWVSSRDLYFTRSRPYKKNDNAHVEQKNYDFVNEMLSILDMTLLKNARS